LFSSVIINKVLDTTRMWLHRLHNNISRLYFIHLVIVLLRLPRSFLISLRRLSIHFFLLLIPGDDVHILFLILVRYRQVLLWLLLK
jgi:hypothetical protein